MGQRAFGILYGCEAPVLPDDEGGDPLGDLVARWERAKKITWGYEGLRVRIESEGDTDLLGVWVAVSGSGKDGAPDFLETCMPLNQAPTVYAKSIARAAKLWERFAAHVAKKEGVVLPAATLWLTPCEVA